MPPIGLPYYAFRAYGLRKGSLLLLSALGVVIVWLAVYLASFQFSAAING